METVALPKCDSSVCIQYDPSMNASDGRSHYEGASIVT